MFVASLMERYQHINNKVSVLLTFSLARNLLVLVRAIRQIYLVFAYFSTVSANHHLVERDLKVLSTPKKRYFLFLPLISRIRLYAIRGLRQSS